MELSPEDKKRIYEEEKARVEAQEKAKKEARAKKTKQGCLGCLALIAVIFIIALIVALFSSGDKKVSKVSYVTQEGSLERAVEKVVIDVMGKTVNWSGNPKTVIGISKTEQLAGPDKGGYLITIKYRANENLTTGMTETGIIIDAMDLTKKLYNDPACSRVKIYMLMPHLTLVDKYGIESEEQVGKLVLRRAVANRINWENMIQDSFKRILQDEGQLWLHPAIAQMLRTSQSPSTITAQNTLSTSKVWYASILQKYFPLGVKIDDIQYPLHAMPCLPKDITKFNVVAEKIDIGLGPAFQVRGTVKLGAVPSPFKVIDGAKGKKYMLHLQAFLFSPDGRIVWEQKGFPKGDAWMNADGDMASFHLINAFEGSTQGCKLLVIGAGDPILSDYDEIRVILGVKLISL